MTDLDRPNLGHIVELVALRLPQNAFETKEFGALLRGVCSRGGARLTMGNVSFDTRRGRSVVVAIERDADGVGWTVQPEWWRHCLGIYLKDGQVIYVESLDQTLAEVLGEPVVVVTAEKPTLRLIEP